MVDEIWTKTGRTHCFGPTAAAPLGAENLVALDADMLLVTVCDGQMSSPASEDQLLMEGHIRATTIADVLEGPLDSAGR